MSRKQFYVLNLTWGLVMTLIGGVAALAALCMGKRPTKHGGCLCFTLGRGWGGVSLGLFMFVSGTSNEHTRNHELGHAVQNAKYGLAFPFIVGIPSALRWCAYRWHPKRSTFPPYDSAWFEAQATAWGDKYIEKWRDNA